MAIIAGLLLLSGLALLCSLGVQLKKAIIRPSHRLYAKDFFLKFLATWMGFLLVLGTSLYFYVFYTVGHDEVLAKELNHTVEFSNIEYLFRSLICSLDLFMLDVDSNILDRLDHQTALKGWLSVLAALSFACTVVMLVRLVYSRLKAYYRLSYCTKVDDSQNHLYLFFGSNTPSHLLIKDIIGNDPKAIAVIIDEANVKEDDNDEWESIVGLITHMVFRTAERIGARVAIASQQLVDIDSKITSRADFDAFGYLGLSKIKELITSLVKTASPQLHIFFMGEDEELNIRNINVLAKDVTIGSIVGNKHIFHRIYCHARYNGPNRVIQDVAFKKHLNIKIVDSSHIAVELLKMDPECHPVQVVQVNEENPATVDSPLKTMIIGFGEVGRDAFRFLYEFGALLSSESSDSNAKKITFDCTVVDKNLMNIQGPFRASMPGIFEDSKNKEDKIRFKSIDLNSDDFYQDILNEENIEGLNYVIISIGNNDEAISLATRIFERVRKKRENLTNLRIFVRCTDDNKVEGIQEIADHYNFGYGKGIDNIPVIRIFGQPQKTYTFDLVISDKLTETARTFHDKYRSFRGEGVSWDERHRSMTDTGIPNLDKLRKLRRQESQDMANAFHIGTKIFLLRESMGESVDWNSFFSHYFNPDGTTHVEGSRSEIVYPRLSEVENRMILHLAMLEHLRWNAAHELFGYQFNEKGTECDERTMLHNCLCAWGKLDEKSEEITEWFCDYKKYDFCVVDTSIALAKEYLLCSENKIKLKGDSMP